MKFLDKKEQVLELQMTQYGKSLLSRGKFDPMFYAFFDDDVIYGSEYMSTGGDVDASPSSLENPTRASDRIKDAIRPQVQHNYAGSETHINRIQYEYEFVTAKTGIAGEEYGPEFFTVGAINPLSDSDILQVLEKPSPVIDNYYSMGLPMGTSGHNFSKAPAIKLILNSGEITDPVTFYTGSSGLLRIPQINVRATYDVSIKSAPAPDQTSDNEDIYEFIDGSYIKVEKESILIDISELNSVFENENYDIEVFYVTENLEFIGSSIGYQENLKALNFTKKQQVQDGLLSDIPGINAAEITTDDVDYYFEISVDDEITDNINIVSSANVYDTPPNDKEPC